MPRSNLCKGVDTRMRLTFGQYITGAMKGVCNQTELADDLGISQPALSVKLKKNQFDMPDFQIIVKSLGLSDEEIISLVRRGRF